MTLLEMQFLGLPLVRYGGVSLNFATRKTLALLIYLALEQEMQPREFLAALLWPESSTGRARANLRNTLSYLRQTLPDESFLHIERDVLGFNPASSYTLDLDAVAAGDSPATLDLVRGDFLTGFNLDDAPDFDDWVTQQRAYWQRRVDRLFDQISTRQMAQGATEAALATATRWVAHNPLNEAAYRRLMRLHLTADDRASALAVYRQCRDILSAELSVLPSPETEALHHTAAAWQPSATPLPAESHTSLALNIPFVGRAAEFQTLVTCYQHTARGATQLVALLGEAGIGKTRLADEFARWSRTQGAEVLTGRGFEMGTHLPYQPLVEALRPGLERVNAPEDLLEDVWLAELSRLLPELRDRYPDLPEVQAADTTALTRLFEAVARLVSALAASSGVPLVLWLDDWQWADAASLEFLPYALRRWHQTKTPVMVILALRSEALHPLTERTTALSQWLDALERELPCLYLRLQPLPEADTIYIVQTLSEADQTETGRWLYRETHGQPFHIVATLQSWAEQNQMCPVENGKWNIEPVEPSSTQLPEPVRQRIVSRLQRLTPAAFNLLIASAVLGRRATFAALCQVSGVDEAEGLDSLDTLLWGQLLQETPPDEKAAETTYLFMHDKIREVAYTEAGDARRRVFHHRALGWLQKNGASSAELAHHAQATDQYAAAFRYHLEAGHNALSLFAAPQACRHFEQAHHLRPHLTTVENDALRQLYLAWGRAHELTGDYDQALQVYALLEQAAQAQADPSLRLDALMAQATVHAAPTRLYDFAKVSTLTDQALPLARDLDDHAAEAKILWNLMLANLLTGQTVQAIHNGEASLAIARQHNLPERIAYALYDLRRAYQYAGQMDKAMAVVQEAQILWRELGNKDMLADALSEWAVYLCYLFGDYDASLQASDEAFALSRSINNVWNQSNSLLVSGFIYMERGEFSRALAEMERCIELGQQADFHVPAIRVRAEQGLLYAQLGAYECGVATCQDALAQADKMPVFKAAPLVVLAYLRQLQGDAAEANRQLQAARTHFSGEIVDASIALVPWLGGEIALRQGRAEEAVRLAQEMVATLRQQGFRPFVAQGLCLLARAHYALGHIEAAQTALQQAQAASEPLQARYVLWQIYTLLSKIDTEQQKAEVYRHHADQLRDYMASNLNDPELRASFSSH